ncbi:MAG: hypothetical protein HKN46_05365 [Acidimicrobiia bacterium]|nr:hypothetical protein [Acidimicrobiia bacterium]
MPGEAITNTTPPTVALLALATFQAGLLAAATPRLERWLAKTRPWTGVVVLGGSIMGLYVWHMTAMVAGALALFAMGGGILGLAPLTADWWLARPVWFGILGVLVIALVLATQRFEKPRAALVHNPWRLVVGTLAMCVALAILLLDGFVDGTGSPNLLVAGAFVLGAELAGANPLRIPARRPNGSPHVGS